MAPPRTKRGTGTRKLSDVARKIVVPKGVASTGWPAVRDKCTDLGISFRPWQDGAGRLILAKRADGKYAATIGGTGMSIPRQVGKTFLVGAIVFALCLLRPGLTVIWTAHRLRTAEETFGKMRSFAKRAKIRPHILKEVLGSGEEAILFRNKSRILFGARESGFGLGFDEVDVLIFDEAQRLRDMTLDDMVPATNQSRQETGALLLFMGTPPRPTDAGEVFTRMRDDATTGEDHDTGWIELGADPGYVPTKKPAPLTDADWKQVAKANPTFPDDTPREAILRMRKQLKDDSFIREGLGVWDTERVSGDLSAEVWKNLADAGAERGKPPVFGCDVASDRTAWVAVAWRRPDGAAQVMLANGGEPFPAFEMVDRCVELREKWGGRFVPPRAFEEAMAREGLLVSPMKLGAFPGACGEWSDAMDEGTIRHGNQSALNDAVATVRWRTVGTKGEREWLMAGHPEVGPLVAATRALYGLTNRPAPAAPGLAETAPAREAAAAGISTMGF